MTIEKKIRIFYILSTIGMIIGMFSSALMLVGFTDTDYGIFNLYLAFFTQLGILSFGFQDGMLINYRKQEYFDILPTLVRDLKFGLIFQIIVLVLSFIIPIIMFLNHNTNSSIMAMFLAVLVIFPNSLLGNIRNAYSSLGKFDIIGYFDFFTKIYLFVGLFLVIIFKLNIFLYIAIDIIFKSLIVLFLYIKIFSDYKKLNINKSNYQYPFSIKNNFKKGLLILIGNWAFVLVFSIDKSMLANHAALLGIYSYAMFFFSTIQQLIVPLKSVIISQIDEKIGDKEIFIKALYLLIVISVIAFIYIIIGEPILSYILNFVVMHFPNLIASADALSQGLQCSSLLTIALPAYICVNIFFMSILTTKNQKQYAYFGTINAIISIIIYIGAIHLIKDNILLAVMIGTIINYLISFLLSAFTTTNLGYTLKLMLTLILIVIGGLAILYFNNIVLNIILLFSLIFIMYLFTKKIKGQK